MNSIPIPVRFSSQTRHLSRTVAAGGMIAPLGKPSPEWLPVPAVRPQTKVVRPNDSVTQPAFWMTPARTGIFEKVLMISLAIAATAGVAYGVASLLDLVQNWAVFHAGVMQLLQ